MLLYAGAHQSAVFQSCKILVSQYVYTCTQAKLICPNFDWNWHDAFEHITCSIYIGIFTPWLKKTVSYLSNQIELVTLHKRFYTLKKTVSYLSNQIELETLHKRFYTLLDGEAAKNPSQEQEWLLMLGPMVQVILMVGPNSIQGVAPSLNQKNFSNSINIIFVANEAKMADSRCLQVQVVAYSHFITISHNTT